MNNDLEKRISDAFCVFDHHGDKFIDVREVGTVLRLLGCVPTEEEVNEVISATESEETSGEVHLTKFLPHVSQLLMERKWVAMLSNYSSYIISYIQQNGACSARENSPGL